MDFFVEIAYFFVVSVTGNVTVIVHGYISIGLNKKQEIAQEMDLSVKTVENHLPRLYRLLNVQSQLEAAKIV